jgi:hypothetical protein
MTNKSNGDPEADLEPASFWSETPYGIAIHSLLNDSFLDAHGFFGLNEVRLWSLHRISTQAL